MIITPPRHIFVRRVRHNRHTVSILRVKHRVRVAHCVNTYLGEGVHLGAIIDQQFRHVLIVFHCCPHERHHPILHRNRELEACVTLELSLYRTPPKCMTSNHTYNDMHTQATRNDIHTQPIQTRTFIRPHLCTIMLDSTTTTTAASQTGNEPCNHKRRNMGSSLAPPITLRT